MRPEPLLRCAASGVLVTIVCVLAGKTRPSRHGVSQSILDDDGHSIVNSIIVTHAYNVIGSPRKGDSGSFGNGEKKHAESRKMMRLLAIAAAALAVDAAPIRVSCVGGTSPAPDCRATR